MTASRVRRQVHGIAAVVIVSSLAAACTSESRPSAASRSSAATSSSTTIASSSASPPAPTNTTASAVQAGPTPVQLVRSLQTMPFAQPTINGHLHVEAVGVFVYADSGPAGRIDSAKVDFSSDIEGEQVSATYDVFPDAGTARRSYDGADTNFRSFQGNPDPAYRAMTLSPATPAFCAGQADGSTQCWLVHDVTTANFNLVNGTAGDDQAVLQAMLEHLTSLGG